MIPYLSIKWKCVENHGTDEGDLRSLRVHNLFVGIDPETSQLGENIDYLKFN